jgi:hypothetical protein
MTRVVVCHTGGVGSQAIRLLARHPTLDLVGVQVHSPAKDGRDVGDLVGIEPLGLRATRDLEDLVALRPDCALWLGTGWQPDIVARLLRNGINTYVNLGGWYLRDQPEFAVLEQACRQGCATLGAGGNIPGLVSDALPLFASGYVGEIRAIRAWQRNLVADYPSADRLRTGLGFGDPMPARSSTDDPEAGPGDRVWLSHIHKSALMVADGLGVPLDELRLTRKEYAAAPADLDLMPSGLHIAAGSVAGARWAFTGYSRGEPFYQLVNEQTAAAGLGPGWRATAEQPQWRVEIDGTPSVTVEFTTTAVDGGFGRPTVELNAARAVNFVPVLVAAPPGCRSLLDLPLVRGTSVPLRGETDG